MRERERERGGHSDAERVSSAVTMPRMLHVLVISFRVSSSCTTCIFTCTSLQKEIVQMYVQTHSVYMCVYCNPEERERERELHAQTGDGFTQVLGCFTIYKHIIVYTPYM